MDLILRLLCNAVLVVGLSGGAVGACSPAPAGTDEIVHATEAPTFGTSADEWPAAEVRITDRDDRIHVIQVRVAEEPEHRRQGLMGVEEVPPGTGMLFLWDGSERDGGFWMKDTHVPLDIAYIRDDAIVDIQRMEPCDDYDSVSECPSYPPAAPYDTALEVPADWFGEQGIVVGSAVSVAR